MQNKKQKKTKTKNTHFKGPSEYTDRDFQTGSALGSVLLSNISEDMLTLKLWVIDPLGKCS